MNQTANYGWKKPGYQDAADIETVGGVFEQIDTKVKEQDNQFSTHQTAIEGLQTAVEGVHTHGNKGVLDGITAAKVAEWDGKATAATYTAAIPASGWSASAPYTQVVSVEGITAVMNPMIDVILSDATATAIAELEAYGYVSQFETGAGTLTCTALEDKPTVSLNVQIKVVQNG